MFSKTIVLLSFILLITSNSRAAFSYEKTTETTHDGALHTNNSLLRALPESRKPQIKTTKKQLKKRRPDVKDYVKAARTWKLLFWCLGFLLLMLSLLATVGLFIAFFWWGLWAYGLFAVVLSLPFFIVSLILYKVYSKKAKQQTQFQNNSNPQPLVPQQQDVIYLKNGSIIKGKLLQATPGGDIKIELVGGSVLVYKMEEVDKIVKE